MDWRQQRVEDLNNRLVNKSKLLGSYENESDYESDPRTKKKLENQISNLKNEIDGLSSEIDDIQKKFLTFDKANHSPCNQALDSVNLRQQYYEEYIQRKRQQKD